MPTPATSTRPTRWLTRLSAVLCGLVLAVGCRSTQSAYQFRPVPAAAVAAKAAPATTGVIAPEVISQQVPVAETITHSEPVVGSIIVREPRRKVTKAALLQRRRLARRAAAEAGYAVVRPRGSHRTTDGPQATSEVGLGTTVLGVLGLVVAPIALVGLLIWGGPVWAILAGLAALAVLVAYIDPFR